MSPSLRRGLPRIAGGEPWPPATEIAGADAVLAATPSAETSIAASVIVEAPIAEPTIAAVVQLAPSQQSASAPAELSAAGAVVTLRRGLPRASGADPWPPAGEAVNRWPALIPAAPPILPSPETPAAEPSPTAATPAKATIRAASTPKTAEAATAATVGGVRVRNLVIGAIALVVVGVAAVLAAQWFRAQPFGADFIETYPGETPLPSGAPVGIPAWLGWQHFFNVFLMVLIIRTGLQVRREKRPTAFWTPRWNAKRKISLALWFHQSLDILWLANGLIFVILLFATGQWMRVVPTDWAVVPNAISALIQYVSLSWPTENGWVNYNSLQVLAYCTTIFIAAPLAAITGVRMSGIWPKKADTLSRIYPVEWARAVHFPVMLYFCAFIVVHVALVLATGALRNLNHMFAGQDAVNWWGFGIFMLSLLVIAAGWIAARPIVLAPIANLFGTVKGR